MRASLRRLLSLSLLIAALAPDRGWACACGCGVFDVQTAGLLPTRPGGIAFLDYGLLDQDKNWSRGSQASAEGNDDKRIQTHVLTAGAQYMFNRRWGIQGQLPLLARAVTMAGANGGLTTSHRSAPGDLRVQGVYSGFSPDMSAGLNFGVKFPTGDDTAANFDRDAQIGTGSADLLLGAYRMGSLTADQRWIWFANGQWEEPVLIAAGYRPGAEINAAAGAYFNDWRLAGLKIAPLAQLIGTNRWRDSGPAGHPEDTGFRRLVLAPGVEIEAGAWRLYADVGFPVAQYVNGNQLVASRFFKLSVGHAF